MVSRLAVSDDKSPRIGTAPYLIASMLHAEFCFLSVTKLVMLYDRRKVAVGFEHQQRTLDAGPCKISPVVALADIADENRRSG
jgi:hypothetical protein